MINIMIIMRPDQNLMSLRVIESIFILNISLVVSTGVDKIILLTLITDNINDSRFVTESYTIIARGH
jgi:hypothetical protein